jgi:hypothetical protein
MKAGRPLAAIFGLFLALSIGSAKADTVFLKDDHCSVSASYLKTDHPDAVDENPFLDNSAVCYVWTVRTKCTDRMRFDYRVAAGQDDIRVKSGTISKGEKKTFCGPGGESERFFVE